MDRPDWFASFESSFRDGVGGTPVKVRERIEVIE